MRHARRGMCGGAYHDRVARRLWPRSNAQGLAHSDRGKASETLEKWACACGRAGRGRRERASQSTGEVLAATTQMGPRASRPRRGRQRAVQGLQLMCGQQPAARRSAEPGAQDSRARRSAAGGRHEESSAHAPRKVLCPQGCLAEVTASRRAAVPLLPDIPAVGARYRQAGAVWWGGCGAGASGGARLGSCESAGFHGLGGS